MGDMPHSGKFSPIFNIPPNDPKPLDFLSCRHFEDVFSKEICRNDRSPLDPHISREEIF